jgi:polyphosphate kinase 2 (PPK2 family)
MLQGWANVIGRSLNLKLAKACLVVPGKPLRLSDIDPSDTGELPNHSKARPELKRLIRKMDELQYLLFADGDQSLLIVLQGMDASGKDGVIRHVFNGMNPQGTTVTSFKQPSSEDLSHDFLWRVLFPVSTYETGMRY